MGTFELVITIGTYIGMFTPTERTSDFLTPSCFGNEISASFVRIEMADKGDK